MWCSGVDGDNTLFVPKQPRRTQRTLDTSTFSRNPQPIH